MEWQPIETAPKDGTAILAWPVAYGDVEIVSWLGRRKLDGIWSVKHLSLRACERVAPTHWKPLDAPPVTS